MQHCHLPVRCRWVLPYTVVLICLVIGRITLRHNGRTCQPLTSNNPLCPLPPTKIGRNLQWISVGILWLHCVVLLFLDFQRFFLQICVLTTTPTAPRSFVSVFSTIYGGQFSTDWKLLVKKSTVGWAAFKVAKSDEFDGLHALGYVGCGSQVVEHLIEGPSTSLSTL